MVLCEGPPPSTLRRRGRPVGSDSAATRSQILRASRQVINERGYQAATFQSIALAAGLSRPTLHYYFGSREEIYAALVDDVGLLVVECTAVALQQTNLIGQLTAFMAALHEADVRDRSTLAFLVTARLESIRNPELGRYARADVRDFLATAVRGALGRGELPTGTAVPTVVEMLHAVLWGVGFHAGFVRDSADLLGMTRQLVDVLSRGLPAGVTVTPTPEETATAVGAGTD